MPVRAPTLGRPGLLLAAVVGAAVVALAIRLELQLTALGDARSELGDAQQAAQDLRAAANPGVGPPLLDARLGKPADELAQQLAALGVKADQVQTMGAGAAGTGLAVTRFSAQGHGDAVAIDRLSLWVKANATSAILERLEAQPAGDGRVDVKLVLDAVVRQGPP